MKERDFIYVNPWTTTPAEAETKLREQLYRSARKAEEMRRDIIYMEELFSVLRMLGGGV